MCLLLYFVQAGPAKRRGYHRTSCYRYQNKIPSITMRRNRVSIVQKSIPKATASSAAPLSSVIGSFTLEPSSSQPVLRIRLSFSVGSGRLLQVAGRTVKSPTNSKGNQAMPYKADL